MKLKKIPRDEAEMRDVVIRPGRSEFGRSTVRVTCPFCGEVTEAYIWSFAGGGKRCSNNGCQAYLTRSKAFRDRIRVDNA